MCLGNISKDFTINNMKKTGLKGIVKFFSVDFNQYFRFTEIFNEKNIIQNNAWVN